MPCAAPDIRAVLGWKRISPGQFLMLVHPQFDPVAIHLGPLAVRWYGLMYLIGFAPAAASAAIARSTSGWMPALQGFIVECPLATPTMGFSKSPSPNPTARSIARLGERAVPSVMRRLRLLRGIVKPGRRGRIMRASF